MTLGINGGWHAGTPEAAFLTHRSLTLGLRP